MYACAERCTNKFRRTAAMSTATSLIRKQFAPGGLMLLFLSKIYSGVTHESPYRYLMNWNPLDPFPSSNLERMTSGLNIPTLWTQTFAHPWKPFFPLDN